MQTAPSRHRQPVAWSGMQGAHVPLRRPANDNRRQRRLHPALLPLMAAAVFGAAVAVVLLG